MLKKELKDNLIKMGILVKNDKVVKSSIISALKKVIAADTGWKLVDKNGKEIKVGDTIPFKGNQVKVTSLEPPHKPGANGRVSTENGRFYANVYDLKFIQENATAGLKKRLKQIL